MIDLRELRIGNYVKVNYGQDVIGTVDSIDKNSIMVGIIRQGDLCNGVITNEEGLIPIPITEELLLKCPFKRDKVILLDEDRHIDVFYVFENIMIAKRMNNTYFLGEEYDSIVMYFNPIYSLHQLQNIYFDLTGEELDIKDSDSLSLSQ